MAFSQVESQDMSMALINENILTTNFGYSIYENLTSIFFIFSQMSTVNGHTQSDIDFFLKFCTQSLY